MLEVISMLVAIAVVYLTDLYLKPVSGIAKVDEFIVYVKNQRKSIANVAVLVGIIVLFSQYLQDHFELE